MACSTFQAISSVAALATAIVSLFLLGQGQQDRRTDKRQRTRSQAEEILLAINSYRESDYGNEYWEKSRLLVVNSSKYPISNVEVTFFRRQSGYGLPRGSSQPDAEGPYIGTSPERFSILRPGEEATFSIPVGASANVNIDADDFAVVSFIDKKSIRWEKRATDQKLIQVDPSTVGQSWLNRTYFDLHMKSGRIGILLHEHWLRRAQQQLKRRPDEIPRMVKQIEFLGGSMFEFDPRIHWAFLDDLPHAYTEMLRVAEVEDSKTTRLYHWFKNARKGSTEQ